MRNQSNCKVLQDGSKAGDHAHVVQQTPQETRIKQAVPLSPMQKQTATLRSRKNVKP